MLRWQNVREKLKATLCSVREEKKADGQIDAPSVVWNGNRWLSIQGDKDDTGVQIHPYVYNSAQRRWKVGTEWAGFPKMPPRRGTCRQRNAKVMNSESNEDIWALDVPQGNLHHSRAKASATMATGTIRASTWRAMINIVIVTRHQRSGNPSDSILKRVPPPRAVPAGYTAGLGSFIRDSFGKRLNCPWGARGTKRRVARGIRVT